MSSDEARIRKWISVLLGEGEFIAASALKTFGASAIPAVLEAMNDPRARATDQNPEPAAIAGLCEVLLESEPVDVAHLLAPQLPVLRGDARKVVIRVLMRLNTAKAFEAITSSLKDDDPQKRSDAEYAVWYGARQLATVDRSLVHDLVRTLASRMSDRHGFALFQLAESIVAIDRVAGASVLYSSPLWNIANPDLSEIVKAFHEQSVRLPSEQLEQLATWLAQDSTGDSAKFSQYALPVLARGAPELVQPFIERLAGSPDAFVNWGRFEAIAVIHGVDKAYHVVTRKLFKPKEDGEHLDRFAELSLEQQFYWASYSVDEQVCNGGFQQFFFNPSGRYAAIAPDALEAIGAPKHAALMREALIVLGPDRLPAAQETYLNIDDEPTLDALSKLDGAYYNIQEDGVLNLLKLYAAAHPTHFRDES